MSYIVVPVAVSFMSYTVVPVAVSYIIYTVVPVAVCEALVAAGSRKLHVVAGVPTRSRVSRVKVVYHGSIPAQIITQHLLGYSPSNPNWL